MERLLRGFVFALAVCLLSPCALAKDDSASSGVPAQDLAAVEHALERGLDIYRYDQAAWHTTDALVEDYRDLEHSGIRGWVVTEDEAGYLVTFWRSDDDNYAGVYSARFGNGKVTDRRILDGEATKLSEIQLGLIKARMAIDASRLERCSNDAFNTVVLPPRNEGDAIEVYLMTPQTSTGSIPLGGHYRFTVENGEVTGMRQFTTGCLDLPIELESGGERSAALYVTHVLDPVPTEMHVFSVFAAGLPIYVYTVDNDRTWVVEVSGGQPRVRFLRDLPEDEEE